MKNMRPNNIVYGLGAAIVAVGLAGGPSNAGIALTPQSLTPNPTIQALEPFLDKGLYVCGKDGIEVAFDYRSSPTRERTLNTTSFYFSPKSGELMQLDVVHTFDPRNPTFQLRRDDLLNGTSLSTVQDQDTFDLLSRLYLTSAVEGLERNIDEDLCNEVPE